MKFAGKILLLGIIAMASMGVYAQQSTEPSTAGQDTLQALLAVVANREVGDLDDAKLAGDASFINSYIKQVPSLLTEAWTSAVAVGLEVEVEKVLKEVKSYWEGTNDVVPDSLGVIGLLDDVYYALSSLQALSDLYFTQTGKPLFQNDLTTANDTMRKIIGEPTATMLDLGVGEAITKAGVKEAVQRLAEQSGKKQEDKAPVKPSRLEPKQVAAVKPVTGPIGGTSIISPTESKLVQKPPEAPPEAPPEPPPEPPASDN